MLKRRLKLIFVTIFLFCMLVWSIGTNQISKYKHGIRMSRIKEMDGWKFNTSFPVDLVYTWVNGSDPKHQELLARVKQKLLETKSFTATGLRNLAYDRFADNGGLRYSLRSLEKYANWIRHVFIVTNGQVPEWLNLRNARVTIVNHYELFDNPEDLPTFSSPAIEHNIYKIRGISDRFIYMNDDIFFGRNVTIEDFYTENNGTKVYLSWPASTQCNKQCNVEMIRNNVCDDVCNYDHCAWDGGDCDGILEQIRPLDTDTAHCSFTTSLFFTNAIYNRAFGTRTRRVIAHAPLYIEKKVNEDMVKRFPTEVKETIKHKLRSPLDFQFGFSYMHFLNEGTNCSNRFDPRIDSDYVSFVMVTGNEYKTRKELTILMKTKRKFICINDNIDYSKPAAAKRTIALLQEFYESMFPNPSSFEISN